MAIFLLLPTWIFGQDITLYEQFNGRYDFTFAGNTLNPQENSYQVTPTIYTSSSATLTLNPDDQIVAAYLYWAGCGTGDFDVLLNNTPITAERTISCLRTGLDYFSAFADVTALVQATGTGNYTLSDLDVTDFIVQSFTNRTNFAGWAMVVVFQNDNLTLNQLNLYDGLQGVPSHIAISLSSLNVIDNVGAKIGFLAWEGDENIPVGESLKINANLIGDPPLNPDYNAFNSTNSITGSNTLYNMDLDVYGIENNIQPGDTSALIELTSGQDFVMVNAIVTKLNSQVPDATITIDDVASECRSLQIVADYTVYNLNSTNPLPPNVPIAIYANGVLVGATATMGAIPIGESQSGTVTITLPPNIPYHFDLTFVVDQDAQGNSTVIEVNEDNNSDTYNVALPEPPSVNQPPALIVCNKGLGNNSFDFSNYNELIATDPSHTIQYFSTSEDAENNVSPITAISHYSPFEVPATVFVRIDDDDCFALTSFVLSTRNCPPIVYNYVSVNNDGVNDTFHIDGLRDIFLNYKLDVYNRWGALVWSGNNYTPEWDGIATKGIVFPDGKIPDGTYYYVLHLNDPDYPEPLKGFLYLIH